MWDTLLIHRAYVAQSHSPDWKERGHILIPCLSCHSFWLKSTSWQGWSLWHGHTLGKHHIHFLAHRRGISRLCSFQWLELHKLSRSVVLVPDCPEQGSDRRYSRPRFPPQDKRGVGWEGIGLAWSCPDIALASGQCSHLGPGVGSAPSFHH